MATVHNGIANGVNGHHSDHEIPHIRFSDIPQEIDIPVNTGDEAVEVPIDLVELVEDPTELCTLLEDEHVTKKYWMTIALAYAKQHKIDHAIEILNKALPTITGAASEKLSILSCLCWMFLWKSREAPRLRPGQTS